VCRYLQKLPRNFTLHAFSDNDSFIFGSDLLGANETAKANGLELYAYLTHVLKALPYADTAEKIEALLAGHFKKNPSFSK
jgi:hypothetical protein